MTRLQTGVQNLAIDRLGNYYYNRGGELYRWVPERTESVCDETVSGERNGPLTAADGVTCLSGATVRGPVTVAPGAGLVVTGSELSGQLSTTGAAVVELSDSTVRGPVRLLGVSDSLVLDGSRVHGPVEVTGSGAGPVLAGNTVTGPLRCSGNEPAPTNDGRPNTVSGPAVGQCAGL